jgi:hypothetical protein
MQIALTPLRTPRGTRYIVRTDSHDLQHLYGPTATQTRPAQPERCDQLIYSRAPRSMGIDRPAQNKAGQP